MDINKLRFPIGEYVPNKNPEKELLTQWINDIESFPTRLEEISTGLSLEQLNWRYRPEGWKVKQVIHHCVDSHTNALIRFKLALTEEKPTIRPYIESRWADLVDAQDDDVSDSITLLKLLHKRLVVLLRTLDEAQLKREFFHPEYNRIFNLAETVGNYAWHGNHHWAHVKLGLESEGKYN